MPIEPPDPTGKILESLVPVLAQLRQAAVHTPGDALIAGAFGNVAAAVAQLRARDAPPEDTPNKA